MGETKFAVKNYEGITVSCTNKRWETHICKHQMMSKNVKAVKDTIEDPDKVYKSSYNDNREVYFKQSEYSTYKILTRVIVEYSDAEKNPNTTVGGVVTAFPAKDMKGTISDVVYERASKD